GTWFRGTRAASPRALWANESKTSARPRRCETATRPPAAKRCWYRSGEGASAGRPPVSARRMASPTLKQRPSTRYQLGTEHPCKTRPCCSPDKLGGFPGGARRRYPTTPSRSAKTSKSFGEDTGSEPPKQNLTSPPRGCNL